LHVYNVYIYRNRNILYINNKFFLNIYMQVCVYLAIQNKYTHIYYVNTNFYFGCVYLQSIH